MTCVDCPDGGEVCGPGVTVQDCPVFEGAAGGGCPKGWRWLHKVGNMSAWQKISEPEKYFYNEYEPWHEGCTGS